jgi:hypothetical protein
MKTLESHDEIKVGMLLMCLSESYQGEVAMMNGCLHSDCMGWGWEPISNIDLSDVVQIER